MKPLDAREMLAQSRDAREARSESGVDPDAIEFQPDMLSIEEAPPPYLARATILLVTAMILIAVAWAYLAKVDKLVTAPGKLRTAEPMIVIQPLETGVVRKFDIRVGDKVRKGDVIAILDPTFAAADLSALRAETQSLEARILRLQAELDGYKVFLARADLDPEDLKAEKKIFDDRKNEYLARLKSWDEKIKNIQIQLAGVKSQEKITKDRVSVLLQLENIKEYLKKENLGKKTSFLRAKDERLEQQQQLANLEDRRRRLEEGLLQIQADREAFVKGWSGKISESLADTRRQRNKLLKQIAKAERRKNLVVLRAPEDAIVLWRAQLSRGSVAATAKPLATLIPVNAVIEADVSIPSRDIAVVHEGDRARIKLEAVPFQKYGTLSGKVKAIAPNTTRIEKRDGTKESVVYKVIIALDSQKTPPKMKGVRLLPGMVITAEIAVGKRSVLSYFLYPVIRALDESLREPQ